MPKEYPSNKRLKSQERTRRQIWAALSGLLESNALDDISVQNICDAAGIHRTTFYNHFYDIYDLVGYGALLILEEIFPEQQVKNISVESLTENVVRFVQEYRRFFRNVTRTDFQQNLRVATQNIFENYLLQIVKNQGEQYKTTLPVDMALKFYCGGVVSVLFYWFEHPEIGTETIRAQMTEIIRMAMRGLLRE